MSKNRFTADNLKELGLIEISPGVYQPANKGKVSPYIKQQKGIVGERKVVGDTKSIPISHEFTLQKPLESVLTIDGIVAGLNGSKGLMRSHWSNIKKQKDLFCMIIKQQMKEGLVRPHEGAVSIHYIGYKSVLMDWDNFGASFKHIGDSLQKCGVIKSDNPKIVRQFLPDQIKCKRNEQKVVVIIKDIK